MTGIGLRSALCLVLCLHLGRACAATPPATVLAPVPARVAPSALAPGWHHGVFAEIYVRGYADGNGDGIGDLRGLIGRLDYLQSLGVRGLWLMPVTRSADRDHGYAVEDYRDIEADYGTLADFDELIAQAHARGIGVIVDYVINHSASTHPVFRAAAAAPDSPWRRWHVWRDPAPGGWSIWNKDPWVPTPHGAYFAQFSQTMPDFELRNPQVMAWHADNLRFWLNRGVDGFRFDAVAHLVERDPVNWRDQPESFAIMREAARLVHSYPNRYLVCEATREEARWAGAEGCGSAFALSLAPHFAKAARGEVESLRRLAAFYADAPPGMATMVSNHDLFAGERLWDQVGGDRRAYELAAAAYLLAGGTPFVYYGEEIGMSAAPALRGDPRLRVPMSWSATGFGNTARPFRALAGNVAAQNVAAEQARADSLLGAYRRLIGLRNAVPALTRGKHVGGRVEGKTWSYRRELGGQVALVAFNLDEVPRVVEVAGLPPARRFRAAFGNTRLKSDRTGGARILVPPRSYAVFVAGRAR